VLTLDRVRAGDRVRVVSVGGPRRLVHRVAALGLVPGAMVTVTRPRGPAIVSVGGANIAVGHQVTRVIEVETV
jgi:Fe2+ transport system protein FeoA